MSSGTAILRHLPTSEFSREASGVRVVVLRPPLCELPLTRQIEPCAGASLLRHLTVEISKFLSNGPGFPLCAAFFPAVSITFLKLAHELGMIPRETHRIWNGGLAPGRLPLSFRGYHTQLSRYSGV